jgi:membrane protein implicated in regulation of membrane protease activity
VLTLIAIALAVFVLPSPWGLVAIIVAAVIDIVETGVFLWWSKRRGGATVGVEALVGREGVVLSDLGPSDLGSRGQVKVGGEIWRARCDARCGSGSRVVVRGVDGLTLVVDPV